MQRQLIQDLERYLQSLEDEEEKITALNAFRQILHEYSPFKSQPVDCVLWVKQDAVLPNDYNQITLLHRKNACCSPRWKRTASRSPLW